MAATIELGQHLADQARVAPSEERTRLARTWPRELHVHHVDAGQDQHADAEGEHGEQQAAQLRRREGPDQRLDQAGAERLVGFRVGAASRRRSADRALAWSRVTPRFRRGC
jgi:hypothetical protein